MTGRVLLAGALGGGVGLGLTFILYGLGWIGGLDPDDAVDDGAASQPPAAHRQLPWRQILTGLLTGTAVLALTRWIAVAIALGAVAGCWTRLFGGTRAAGQRIERLEALAGWTESLRDLVATGLALPEALIATATTATLALAEPLLTLAERLRSREPLEAALYALADELDDSTADLVVAALLLNTRAHGRQLQAVLTALAHSTREETTVRRAIDAERRATRRGVRIVLAVTIGMALGLEVFNPSYLAPYQTATGQFVLAGIVGVFGLGFGWLQRLSAIPVPARFLSSTEQAWSGRDPSASPAWSTSTSTSTSASPVPDWPS